MADLPAGTSLYRRLGGHEPLAAVVDAFSRRVAADHELARYFTAVDFEGLRRHQVAFLAAAFGGPQAYRGPTLRQAHRGLGITAHHFALFVEHLAGALATCDVPPALRAEVLEQIAALSGEVVE